MKNKKLTPSQKKIFETLKNNAEKMGLPLCINYDNLAAQVGCCSKTIQRSFHHFENVRIIKIDRPDTYGWYRLGKLVAIAENEEKQLDY